MGLRSEDQSIVVILLQVREIQNVVYASQKAAMLPLTDCVHISRS